MRKPFVMGNWKLNGDKQLVNELIASLKQDINNMTHCLIAIAPPTPYLEQAYTALEHSSIQLGAQNCDIHLSGAYTGDTSAAMLKDIGAKYVIIGHSERRAYHHENDEFIAEKFAVLKEQGLIPVLCIGETEAENEAGLTKQVCVRQIDAIFNKLGSKAFDSAVIAYEPIWAIGTGKSATPEQAQEVHKFIRDHLSKHDHAIAANVILQYGGSVNDKNAEKLFAQPDIDGALVGGASLKSESFAAIVKAAANSK